MASHRLPAYPIKFWRKCGNWWRCVAKTQF